MSETTKAEYDVIIVGAGMAGLGAARKLADQGLDILLLEARDRLGGRVLTDRTLARRPIELGAELLHTAQNPLLELYANAEIATVGVGGTRTLPAEFSKEIARVLDRIPTPNREQSVENYLAGIQSSFQRELLTEGFDSQLGREELRRTSAADAVQELRLEVQHGEFMSTFNSRVPQGMDQGPKLLAQDLPVLLNARVERIEQTRDGVLVHAAGRANQQSFFARRVVITLPLGVLKNNDVQFEPPLPPANREAIQEIISLDIVKVMFTFDGEVWSLPGQIQYVTDGPLSAVWNSSFAGADPSQTIAVAWAVGDKARRLGELKTTQLLEDALSQVRRTLGKPDIVPTTTGFHSWMADPYSRGAYSHLPPGAVSTARQELAKPIDNKIFWAGEATAQWRPRTVHGAYGSGLRAADEILAAESFPRTQ
ncbi:NAD(P)/FAD-dependent oxidoreductase [Glutamicibacter creatinolyticus]|uniref:flavin monoamine oxidase family protein n=1 Tax=Glutamicibacter creatinolyticus TaxID=162496 RepID=UPI0031DB1595